MQWRRACRRRPRPTSNLGCTVRGSRTRITNSKTWVRVRVRLEFCRTQHFCLEPKFSKIFTFWSWWARAAAENFCSFHKIIIKWLYVDLHSFQGGRAGPLGGTLNFFLKIGGKSGFATDHTDHHWRITRITPLIFHKVEKSMKDFEIFNKRCAGSPKLCETSSKTYLFPLLKGGLVG